jgi:hypothetical protein
MHKCLRECCVSFLLFSQKGKKKERDSKEEKNTEALYLLQAVVLFLDVNFENLLKITKKAKI